VWTVNGDVAIGMSNIAIEMLFVVIGASKARKAKDEPTKPKPD